MILACLALVGCGAPKPQAALSRSDLYAITGDGHTICAVGAGGLILRSHDGGTTWRRVRSPNMRDMFAIASPRDGEFWAGGSSGTVFRSVEDCRAWTEIDAPTFGASFYAVWGAGDVAFLVGDSGSILRARSGAVDRQTPLEPSSEMFVGVWGSGLDDVYVAGDRGSLLTSADGGDNWVVLVRAEDPHLDPKTSPIPVRTERVESFLGTSRANHLASGFVMITTRMQKTQTPFVRRAAGAAAKLAGARADGWRLLHADAAGRVYALVDVGAKRDLVVSKDHGATFERRKRDVPKWTDVWREPEGGALLAVGARGQIDRSDDDGRTWRTVLAAGRPISDDDEDEDTDEHSDELPP
jgi:hypothetical protein